MFQWSHSFTLDIINMSIFTIQKSELFKQSRVPWSYYSKTATVCVMWHSFPSQQFLLCKKTSTTSGWIDQSAILWTLVIRLPEVSCEDLKFSAMCWKQRHWATDNRPDQTLRSLSLPLLIPLKSFLQWRKASLIDRVHSLQRKGCSLEISMPQGTI